MKKQPLTAVIGSCLFLLVAGAQTQTDETGFEPLFSGKESELPNWMQVGKGGFVLQDGTLATQSEQGGGGFFYVKSEFRDFILRLEWKAETAQANSGVFVRVPDLSSDKPWLAGYEIQILDSDPDPLRRTGAIYSVAGSSEVVSQPGQWNTMEIRGVGQRYTVLVNNKVVCQHDGNGSLQGYVGLQNHSGKIWFRNVRIKRLSGVVASASGTDNEAVQPVDPPDSRVWPNAFSHANSDDWLAAHHDEIRLMRPRLLVLNFVNGLSSQEATRKVNALIAAVRESSRYHGYKDPQSPAFLNYQIYKVVDLTDKTPPIEKLDGNSTKYPRVPNWKQGINFQYAQLFRDRFTEYYDIPDPQQPTRKLSLRELVDRGIVHEVWFLALQKEYGAPFECVEVKQAYDENLRKLKGQSRQAGNGGDPNQPFIGRSLRILFINVERGPGCAMESLSHAIEGMGHSNVIPYFRRYFYEYAGFDLYKRYGLPFNSLYGKGPAPVRYPDTTTLVYKRNGQEFTVQNYIPIGGNVHYPPNGRSDYDMTNPQPVMSTIENYRMRNGPDGKDLATEWDIATFERYKQLANDCMGPWLVYWRQNMPGLDSKAKDDDGKPMKNWWVFLFY
jgi:hypothetical protein